MNSLILKVKSNVPVLVSRVRAVLPMLVVMTVVALTSGGISLAAEGDPPELSIKEVVPQAQWTSAIDSLKDKLAAVVVAMLGLAIGLLIVGILYRVVKKYASKGA